MFVVCWLEPVVGSASGGTARSRVGVCQSQSQMSVVSTWQTRRDWNDSDAARRRAQPTKHHHCPRTTRTRRQRPQDQLCFRCWFVVLC